MSVSLWAARLDRPLTEQERACLAALLPPERRGRLPRQTEAWREPLCAYLLLRRALEEQYHWREWPRMARGELGKPTFPDHPEVCFSLSHTEGAVLVALADGEVGVDVQRVRPVSPRMRQRLAAGEREEAFFRVWVRREARTKRTGRGIAAMLGEEPPLAAGEAYHELDLFPGYAAGVAFGEGEDLTPVRTVPMEDLLRFAAEHGV